MRLIQKTEDYLKGKLATKENDNFTKELVHDYFEKEKLKKHWGTLLDEDFNLKTGNNNNSVPAKSSKIIPLLAFATTIAASLLLIFYVFVPGQVEDNQLSAIDVLLNEHYATPFNRTMLKGPNETAAQRTKAFELYNGREYEKAIPLLTSFVQNGTAIEDDYFFLGLSHLYSKQPEEAIIALSFIYQKEDMQRKDAATWYLALAYVANNECEDAKPLLENVATWKGNSGKLKLANNANELLEIVNSEGCNH